MMKKTFLALGFLVATACGPITPRPTPSPSPSPSTPAVAFDLIACAGPVADNWCPGIGGASFVVNNIAGTHVANSDGFLYLQDVPGDLDARGGIELTIDAAGYEHFDSGPLTLKQVVGENARGRHNFFFPNASKPPLAPPPTRDEFINLKITFQGLTVDCPPYGSLPWFEAALAWVTPECRANVYAAKHASTAWGSGDTHALIFLPSGPALYDEPNQPYSADRFGPLDWTAGNTKIDDRFTDLLVEVINNGFNRVLVFEGGDDGERGFPIAMQQLDLLHDALVAASPKYGKDLRAYVAPLPGFDGVFYGYTPEHITAWVAKCRALFIYCAFETSTGHIPTGEGDADWTGAGGMRGVDLLLHEFDDDRYDDTIWQIGARMLGPAYTRGPDQPANDDPGAPFGPNAGQFYLRQPTDRGRIADCAFEFREYSWVHHNGTPGDLVATNKARAYLKARGWSCGG